MAWSAAERELARSLTRSCLHLPPAALGLKKKWEALRKQQGKDASKPNLVMGAQGERENWVREAAAAADGCRRQLQLLPLYCCPPSAKCSATPRPAVHVCWQKFCRYFDVEERYVPVEEGRYVATPELIRPLVDENTIGERLI